MTVSVIIPVYQVERYLVRCLDSVLAAAKCASAAGGVSAGSVAQVGVEIICVNDGSTDGSADILEAYREQLSPSGAAADGTLTFRIVTKANGGLGSARNAGMAVATGDYLMFVDSDDCIPPAAIASFLSVATASGLPLVVSMATMSDRDGAPLRFASGDVRPENVGWRAVGRNFIAGKKVQYCAWNKFYKRELIVNRPFPRGVYEDFSWTTGILCDLERFAVIAAPLYVYCLNQGAVSLVRSQYSASKNADSMSAIRRVLEYANGRDDCWRFALHQAADGLSSTVGQVYKSRDSKIIDQFLADYSKLGTEFPEVVRGLTLKARWRLWRLKRNRRSPLVR